MALTAYASTDDDPRSTLGLPWLTAEALLPLTVATPHQQDPPALRTAALLAAEECTLRRAALLMAVFAMGGVVLDGVEDRGHDQQG
jgi:hypothetical protein